MRTMQAAGVFAVVLVVATAGALFWAYGGQDPTIPRAEVQRAEGQSSTCHQVTVDGIPYVCLTETPTPTPTGSPTVTSTVTPTAIPTATAAVVPPTPTPAPAAAIVRESVSTVINTVAIGTVTVTKPAGTAAGDVLVACLALNGGNMGATGVPAGWTLIAAPQIANPRVFGYYHVAGGSEPASYVWTLTSAVSNSAGVARYSGVNNATVLDAAVTVGTGTGTNAPVPSTATGTPGAAVIGCMGINTGNVTVTLTPPDGLNEAWNLVGKRQEYADAIQPAVGQTGERMWTLSAAREWAGWLTALRPATPGAPGPSPTATPIVTATPTPTPAASTMPVGDIPGWTQVFTEDFTVDVPVGQFPGASGAPYFAKWKLAAGAAKGTYPDGWTDTTANGTYYPSKVLSTHDGLLDMFIHTEAVDGITKHMVAAPVPQVFQQYGRYSVRFSADAIVGYKTAWLLWPMSEVWPRDGEIDFPEGDLEDVIKAFAHYANPAGGQDAFSTTARYTDWHIATTEWSPGKIVFILDGTVIGTSTVQVPATPMKWVLQTETQLSGGPPEDAAQGHVFVDWAVAYSFNAPPSTPTPTPTPLPAGAALKVAAVGDIHPPSSSANSAGTAAEAAKADIILGLGDYQYQTGSMSDLNAYFDKTWGPLVPKMYPVLAPNHDQYWRDADPLRYFNGGGASGYKTPITLAPHQSYAFSQGGWRFMAIDDSCYRDTSSCSTAALLQWVKDELAAHPGGCTIAYWHQAYFTSTTNGHGQETSMGPIVTELANAGVDIVLSGHNHDYERFAPQNASRVADPNGIRAFVVGTGGIGFYTFSSTAPNSVARTGSTYGVLQLTLRATDYDWSFVRTGGTAFTDSGSGACH